MDELKPYRRNESELERLVGIVKGYSDGIGMQFGLDKYGVLVMERDVKKKSVGIGLPGAENIRKLDNSRYKHLGYLETEITMERETKERLKGEYYTRVRMLLWSKLYGGKVIKEMNLWAVLEIRYTAAMIE